MPPPAPELALLCKKRHPTLCGFRGWLRALLVLPCLAAALSGCGTLAYYTQAAAGQLSLLGKRQPIDRLLADPQTPARLRHQLELVLRLRAFAGSSLHLPVGSHYEDYADLERNHVVWNVFVAPELSLQASRWCFPIAGCVHYRGYFSEESARAFADGMASEGFDTYVAGVSAYSTLGWMRDPVLSTFVFLPESQLAELIFHELAHQLLYVPGDTLFNESFATTVALEGVRRWLHARGRQDLYEAHLASVQREQEFVALLARYRASLGEVYRSDRADTEKRRLKTRLIAELRQGYARLDQEWGGIPRYQAWIDAPINNAKLNAVSLYHGLVPSLQRLLVLEGNHLPSFYRRCHELAELDDASRHQVAKELAGRDPPGRPAYSCADNRRGPVRFSPCDVLYGDEPTYNRPVAGRVPRPAFLIKKSFFGIYR